MPRRRAKSWQFVMERDFWMDGKTLCAAEKMIVATLAAHCSMDLTCWPTKPQLCEATGMSLRSLWDHLHTLKAKGFISWREVRDQKGRKRALYTLYPSCKICMMGSSKATMQLLPAKLRRYTAVTDSPKIIPFKPRKPTTAQEANQ